MNQKFAKQILVDIVSYEVGRLSGHCGFHNFCGCKFLDVAARTRDQNFQNIFQRFFS